MGRPETGTMKFKADWRGVFMRGDDAFGWHLALQRVIQDYNPVGVEAQLAKEGLIHLSNLLDLSNEAQHTDVDAKCQLMKPFEECTSV